MKNKKLLACLLAACLAFVLCACGTGEPASQKNPTANPDLQNTAANSADVTDVSTDEPVSDEQSKDVQFETTEVYNSDGVLIVAKSIDKGLFGTEIKFYVENNTDKNIAVSGDVFVINGITVSDFLYIEVAANKKANDTFTLSSSNLEEAGIKSIAYIEFVDARIVNTDTFLTIADCPFRIETNLLGTFEQSVDDSGDILYDKDGITVIVKSLKDHDLILLVKNESGQDIVMQSDNASVNGFTVGTIMSGDVIDGTVRFCEMTLSSTDLEENEITQIGEIAFILKFINPQTFSTIAATSELTVSF